MGALMKGVKRDQPAVPSEIINIMSIYYVNIIV